jgi:DNA-binding transcriptional MerR regulator
MNYFSISQLARYSGIKPHTIRMWEQRYNALTPNRSDGNTRYYDNKQLRRLLNIVSLLESDYKVSELCSMPDKKLFSLVEGLPTKAAQNDITEFFVLQLIRAGMSYDEMNFDKIFSHCLLKYGIKEAYIKVIYPMLRRVGVMWTTDALEPAAEHFISNQVRQKLFTVIDSLPAVKTSEDSWLLFLPENEFHEIGLLFANFLIRQSGRKVVYLGANVPLESLFVAVKETSVPNVLLFLTHNDLPGETEDYLKDLSLFLGGKKIYVATDQSLSEGIESPENIHWLSSPQNLEQLLPLS